MKKLLVLIMALCLALTGVACGGRNDGNNGGGDDKKDWDSVKKTDIRIYVDESNVYGAYIQGSDENFVKEEIEKKFYEDTGVAVKFEILYNTHATFSQNFGNVMTTGQWDAAVSYLGQAGLEETVLNQDVAMNLSDLLDEYGSHIKTAVDANARYAATTLTGEVIGIPSVMKTKQKGVLVRKDYMRQVGYTESKAEADASGGTLKHCRTINDFNDMVKKMKSQISKCTTPIIGNCYDIEFTLLAGVCGTAGYQYKSVNYESDGTTVKEVVPGWLSNGYQEMLNYMYDWQVNGLWEADNATIKDEQRVTNFANGLSGVYVADPTISNLINVARQVKNVDKNAEFTILPPLDAVDGSGNPVDNSGAFVENSRTTDCLIVNKRSAKAEIIVKYLDWMYSSVDNYELCAYGVKGTHWVDAGEGFYNYPEGMEDRYLLKPPYSGVFALLHNDEFAYRRFNSYTEEELAWINTVESARTIKNDTDGMLFYNMPQAANANFTLAEADIYLKCAVKAWDGSADPRVTYPEFSAKYRSQASDYIEWLTSQYKLYLASRA